MKSLPDGSDLMCKHGDVEKEHRAGGEKMVEVIEQERIIANEKKVTATKWFQRKEWAVSTASIFVVWVWMSEYTCQLTLKSTSADHKFSQP